MRLKEPNIFAYSDYRAYLLDWIESKRNQGYSARWFAKRAGFRAHNVLQLVATGKRNLSMESIGKFIIGLGLTEDQGQCFESLVLMNQASDQTTRTKHYRKIVDFPERRNALPFQDSQYLFFRRWLGPVIYEMTRLKGFRSNPAWIGRQFVPQLSADEVEAVLNDLLDSGLLKREANGSLVAQPYRLDTGDDVGDLHVYAYHEQSLLRASDALHWINTSARHFQVVTAAVPSTIFPKLRKIAAKFEKELWACIDSERGDKNEVLQVSLQIFPTLGKDHARVTKKQKKR